MTAVLSFAAVALFLILVLAWTVEHCLAEDREADPMEAAADVKLSQASVDEVDAMSAYAEAMNPGPLLALRTHRVLLLDAPQGEPTLRRRILVSVMFVLAMVVLSAWIGGR